MRTSLTEHRHIVLYVLAVAGLLLIPVGLMAVSDNVKLSAFDFIAAGVLLLGTGLAFELVSRRTGLTKKDWSAGRPTAWSRLSRAQAEASSWACNPTRRSCGNMQTSAGPLCLQPLYVCAEVNKRA